LCASPSFLFLSIMSQTSISYHNHTKLIILNQFDKDYVRGQSARH
jgi:hypothetical protein